jgi:hypothetical protein
MGPPNRREKVLAGANPFPVEQKECLAGRRSSRLTSARPTLAIPNGLGICVSVVAEPFVICCILHFPVTIFIPFQVHLFFFGVSFHSEVIWQLK